MKLKFLVFLCFIGVYGLSKEVGYVCNSDADTISVIDTATNKSIEIVVGESPLRPIISLDKTKLYILRNTSPQGYVTVVSTLTNKVLKEIRVGNQPQWGAITPDGKKLYVTNQLSNSVSVIDTSTDSLLTNISVASAPNDGAITQDGSTVYILNTASPASISLIDTATDLVTQQVSLSDQAVNMALSPDDSLIYVTILNLEFFSIPTSTYTPSSVSTSQVNFWVIFNPTREIAYFSEPALYGGSSDVLVVDSISSTPITTIPLDFVPIFLTSLPNGNKIYVPNLFGTHIAVIDADLNQVVGEIQAEDSPEIIAFNADASKGYVSNGNSASVSVFDTATNEVLTSIPVGLGPGYLIITNIPFVPPEESAAEILIRSLNKNTGVKTQKGGF